MLWNTYGAKEEKELKQEGALPSRMWEKAVGGGHSGSAIYADVRGEPL